MENYSGKLKTYSLSVLFISLIAVILRTASFFTDFDETVGYFNNSNPLGSIFVALAIITLIWIFSAFVLIPKNVLPKENHGVGYIGGFGSVFSIVASVAAVVVFAKSYIDAPTSLLPIIAAVFFLLAIGYFLLTVKGKGPHSSAHALLGLALIIALIMLLATVYFDMKVAMNSPIKIMLQLSLLVLMLFFISDIRFLLGRALPRCYLVTSLLALFFGLSASMPEMLAFLFGKLDNASYFMYSFIIFAYTTFVAARLFSYSAVSQNTPSENAEREEK